MKETVAANVVESDHQSIKHSTKHCQCHCDTMDKCKVHSQETQIYLVRLAVKKPRLASYSAKSAVKKPRPTWWGWQSRKQDLPGQVSSKKTRLNQWSQHLKKNKNYSVRSAVKKETYLLRSAVKNKKTYLVRPAVKTKQDLIGDVSSQEAKTHLVRSALPLTSGTRANWMSGHSFLASSPIMLRVTPNARAS